MALIRIQSSPLPAKPWNSASPRRGALSRVKEFLLCFPVPRLPSDPERNPCTPPRPDNGNDYNPAISSGTQPLPSSLPSIDGRQSDGFWALNLTHGRAGDRGPNVYALPTALRMLASAASRAAAHEEQRIIAICSSGHRKSDTPEAICTTNRRTARGVGRTCTLASPACAAIACRSAGRLRRRYKSSHVQKPAPSGDRRMARRGARG